MQAPGGLNLPGLIGFNQAGKKLHIIVTVENVKLKQIFKLDINFLPRKGPDPGSHMQLLVNAGLKW